MFGDLRRSKKDCRLVKKGAKLERDLSKKYTCEQAALYADYNARYAVWYGKHHNMEKFFYYTAQSYAGFVGVTIKCKTCKQAVNAFFRSDVVLGKKIIKKRGGNFKKCLAYSQTGFETYKGLVVGYLKMNQKMMRRYLNKVYDWESGAM